MLTQLWVLRCHYTLADQIYSCQPTNTSFDSFAETAVFHDPVGFAEGKGPVRAQFESLPKLFKGCSDIDKFEVLETPNGGNLKTILVNQDVSCTSWRSSTLPVQTLGADFVACFRL